MTSWFFASKTITKYRFFSIRGFVEMNLLSWATNSGEGTRSTSIPMKKSGKFDPISVCFFGRRATLRRKLFGNQKVLFDSCFRGFDEQNTSSSKVSNGNKLFLLDLFSNWVTHDGTRELESLNLKTRLIAREIAIFPPLAISRSLPIEKHKSSWLLTMIAAEIRHFLFIWHFIFNWRLFRLSIFELSNIVVTINEFESRFEFCVKLK